MDSQNVFTHARHNPFPQLVPSFAYAALRKSSCEIVTSALALVSKIGKNSTTMLTSNEKAIVFNQYLHLIPVMHLSSSTYISGIVYIILNILGIVKGLSMLFWLRREHDTDMISYKPFYETLFKRSMTEYTLIYKFGMPANTLHRIKHGKPITTTTLDTLCSILNCSVQEIIEYLPEE